MANINIPTISVGKMVERVSEYFIASIRNDVCFKKVRSVLMTGRPGVGKSEGVWQIAERVKKETGFPVEVREIRLSNCSLLDIIGVAAPDANREYTVILKPDFFREPEDPDTILIYFFDELDKTLPAIQKAALQLILDKRSFVHELPKRSLVLAACNPECVEDTVSSKFEDALNNRFRHYFIQPDLNSWMKWAKNNHVNPYVMDYLTYDPGKLYCQNEEESDTAFPTPRSWKAVSDYLNLMFHNNMDLEELHLDLCGDIGMGAALEFEEWYRLKGKLPSMEDIFSGRTCRYPDSQDVLEHLVSGMIAYIKNNKKKITLAMLENGLRYANCFPADFKTLFYTKAQEIKWIRLNLLQIPEFKKWWNEQKEENPV